MRPLIGFCKQNFPTVSIAVILFLAAFLRLYRIGDYLIFLGDEGRDVLIVKGILQGHLTLLGPRASAGDFFTGPIYYYLMAPFLWLFHLDPVGPAVMVALFGVATVFLIFYLSRYWFGLKAALFASFLYALSPLIITYSRSSWNPNPMPFFTLLMLMFLYKAVKEKRLRLFFYSGFVYGVMMQLHYQAAFLALAIFFFIILGLGLREKKPQLILALKAFLVYGFGFLAGISLFLGFEIRHGFPNTRTILGFILSGGATPGVSKPFVNIVCDVFFKLFGRSLTNFPQDTLLPQFNPKLLFFWGLLTLVLAFAALFSLIKIKDRLVILLIILWLFLGVFSFGFYKKPIYDYYLAFMFPLPFFLIGNFLSTLWDNFKFYKAGVFLSLFLLLVLVALDLYFSPLRTPPNGLKEHTRRVADFVLKQTENKPFNFALLAANNSDYAYRYFFSLKKRDPVTIEPPFKDPKRQTVQNELLVICEDPKCSPLGNPLWEIAGFGKAKIKNEWQIEGVKIYKLVH